MLNKIDTSQYIYEYIRLQLPQKRIHPDGECNVEVISKLNNHKAGRIHGDEIDPRWEPLKEIISQS